MKFPLPELDDEIREALQKTWQRHRLEPYLRRWRDGFVPEIPEAFFDFDWRACDVGCGMGKFILREAEAHPEHAYLGIDKGAMRGGTMLRRVGDREFPNLFGLLGNATPILAKMAPSSLDLITVFYPNPWWPKKHRKKRWPFHPLLPQLTHLLKPGGELWVASNEAFYLAEWQYALTHHPLIESMVPIFAGPIDETEGRSHFETKFLAESTPCGELRFQKVSQE